MNSTLTGAIGIYLAQVRAELGDLPPGELEDVLEDVASHLTEVAAEFQQEPTADELRERLGSPRQYADELRTAAGYPPPGRPEKPTSSAADRALHWGIVAATVGPFFVLVGLLTGATGGLAFFGAIGLIVLFGAAYQGLRTLGSNPPRSVLDTPRGARAAEYVRGVIDQIPPNVRHEVVTIGQPVWWVARGMVGGGGFFALFGAGAVAVVGALAGAGVSIWIGRRTQQDPRWLWYVVPLNVVAVLAVPAVFAAAFAGQSGGLFSSSRYGDYSATSNYSQPGVVLDGEPVTNIYPFDEQGRPVRVRLYTQDGKPLNVPLADCFAVYGEDGYGDRSTNAVSNLFPLAVIDPQADSDTGDWADCRDTTKAPFVPPPVPASPIRPTPTPDTSAGPTSTPSQTPPDSPTTPSTPTAEPTTGRSVTPPTPGVTLTISPTR